MLSDEFAHGVCRNTVLVCDLFEGAVRAVPAQNVLDGSGVEGAWPSDVTGHDRLLQDAGGLPAGAGRTASAGVKGARLRVP
jgi:hypothetical protein